MGRPGLMLHRKTRRLARELDGFQAGFGAVLARGALELLWDACYEAGDPYQGDAADVESRAGWAGDDGVLTAALLAAGGPGRAGFIEEGGSEFWPEGAPGTYRVHDLFDHAPRYVRRRVELEAKRQDEGKTISALRSEAGRKGAAVTNGKRTASDRQAAVRLPSVAGHGSANERQLAATPAPAPAHTRGEASPVSSAPPPTPRVARKARRSETEGPPVEPLRLRLVALIRAKGIPYVEAIVEERTQLRRAIKTPGVTEAAIEDAFRTVYARGGWNPRIQDVARVLTAASERRGGNGAAPVSDFSVVPDPSVVFGRRP